VRTESPNGVGYISQYKQDSPLHAEEQFTRTNHRFPQSTEEFLAQLLHDVPKIAVDWLSLGNDFARGLLERERLKQAAKNGSGDFHGDGSVVFLAPGFGSMPIWYRPAVDFFEKAGYQPVSKFSNSIINLEPIGNKKREYMKMIIDLAQKSGQKVHYVGDSQGGLTAAALAVDFPKEFIQNVADVWFIGAPKPRRVNVLVGIAYLWSQLWYGGNDFKLAGKINQLDELVSDGRVSFQSIYRRRDVVLPDGLPIGKHYSTDGSHIGGAVNLKHLNLIVSNWNGNHNHNLKIND